MTGCAEISDGCKHCYTEWMAGRLRAMGVEKYRRGFEVAVHENALKEPLEWKRPRLVFVNSMSDLFHEAVSAEFPFSSGSVTTWRSGNRVAYSGHDHVDARGFGFRHAA